MNDSSSRGPWRWPLVIGIVLLSGGALVAASAWAQMPWRQVPLTVLSFWLGGALPIALGWAWKRGVKGRRERGPGRRSNRAGPERANAGEPLAFPWVPKPVDMMHARQVLAGGIFLFPFTIASIVSDSVREWFLPPGAEGGFSREVLGMLIISGCFIGLSLQMFDAVRGGAAILIDADGFTVNVGRTRSRMLWREVDGLTTEGRFLIVESSGLTKGRAGVLNSSVGRRQGYAKAARLWTAQRPRATICDIGALTVPKNRLFKAIKKHWGGEIARR